MGTGERFNSLDFLKFAAAVLIVFHHYQQDLEVTFDRGINFYHGAFYFGYIVELFFIVSGFLMAYGLSKYAQQPLDSFFIKRLKRLLPMVWITVTVTAILHVAYRVVSGTWLVKVGIWRYLTSMTLLFSGGIVKIDGKGINNPIWYLCVLLECYIVFWILAYLWKNKNIKIHYLYISMLVLWVGIHCYNMELPFFNAHVARGMMPFFVGCVLYLIYEKRHDTLAAAISFIIFAGLVGAVLVGYKLFFDDLSMILVFVMYPSFIMFLLSSKTINTLLRSDIFSELGKISYGMYLWHYPIFQVIMIVLIVTGNEIPQTFAVMAAITVGIIILSVGSYYLIEKPINKKIK